MMSPKISDWIVPLHSRPSARVSIFCLPYAGGGASIYRSWARAFPETVEVCTVQLPGREQYLTRQPFVQLSPLVAWLTDEIAPWLDRPYLLFGHSMGAFICFELTRQLRRLHRPLPEYLCVSGARAPHIPNPYPDMHQMTATRFLQELHRLEGTPHEVLQNKELMQLLLPLLRADFSVCETYTYVSELPLPCSLSVFGGWQDQRIPYPHLAAWQQHIQGAFNLRMFDGNHFFLHSAAHELLSALKQDVEKVLIPRP